MYSLSLFATPTSCVADIFSQWERRVVPPMFSMTRYHLSSLWKTRKREGTGIVVLARMNCSASASRRREANLHLTKRPSPKLLTHVWRWLVLACSNCMKTSSMAAADGANGSEAAGCIRRCEKRGLTEILNALYTDSSLQLNPGYKCVPASSLQPNTHVNDLSIRKTGRSTSESATTKRKSPQLPFSVFWCVTVDLLDGIVPNQSWQDKHSSQFRP